MVLLFLSEIRNKVNLRVSEQEVFGIRRKRREIQKFESTAMSLD